MTDDHRHAPVDDRDRIMRIIRRRCGDVLSDADLALIADAPVDSDAQPGSIGLQILEVVERMADRRDEWERAVRPV
jgi:hypothetical protein